MTDTERFVVRVTKDGATSNFTNPVTREVAERSLKDARVHADSSLTTVLKGATFSLARVVYEPVDGA